MKKITVVLLTLCVSVALGSPARADLSSFLYELNVQARGNHQDYGLRLSSQFGVALPNVELLLRSVSSPADAFMCLQISQMLGVPPQRVLRTYQQNRGQGWGRIAQQMGIKPGSANFHALKQGNFTLKQVKGRNPEYPEYQGSRNPGKGQGKGQGKGHGHGKGRGKGQGNGPNK
ncbi:hypothetical protein JWJ90_11010 [Desulfobulbus rhabdoformis]|jgi:hypothetical protein|uniref:hypothetical protein n=1 Tax=Desulfobulbus rhabdoformis TaxID=34032 RepID=UPI00196639B3|nr:hypothetical protein [Desulfobulbus rhabdoformis]MBM9614813.1 hypothetical protein [Desulfobulbus rhabdoformis]